MKIAVFGCELSGLVTSASLANTGNQVLAIPVGIADVDELTLGVLPRDEPGLRSLVMNQLASNRLKFEADWHQGIEHAEVIFLSMPSWRAEQAESVIDQIGLLAKKDVLVVNQSTLPVGTADRFEAKLKLAFAQRGLVLNAVVAAMPEFISEGTALDNFVKPDRIVLGCENLQAIEKVKDLMRPFNHVVDQFKIMSTRAAEYTKFAVNALLATRISLVNELANNAEHYNVDMEQVRQGLGSDSRIGFNYLFPGCGFGGPSFAADVQSMVEAFQVKGYDADLLESVMENNESQKEVLFRKAWRYFKQDIRGLKFAVWGLSFKPNTSTVANAPSLKTVQALVAQGAEVVVFDPKANDAFLKAFGESPQVSYATDMYDALADTDALFLMTEWKQFWNPDYETMKRLMNQTVIFDGRNIFEQKFLDQLGFQYYGIGRGKTI